MLHHASAHPPDTPLNTMGEVHWFQGGRSMEKLRDWRVDLGRWRGLGVSYQLPRQRGRSRWHRGHRQPIAGAQVHQSRETAPAHPAELSLPVLFSLLRCSVHAVPGARSPPARGGEGGWGKRLRCAQFYMGEMGQDRVSVHSPPGCAQLWGIMAQSKRPE